MLNNTVPALLRLVPSDFVGAIQGILLNEPAKGQTVVNFMNEFLPLSVVENNDPLITIQIIGDDGDLSETVAQAMAQFNTNVDNLNAGPVASPG